MIDFYLSDMPDAPVTLDILKEDGTLIRRFVGKTGGDDEAANQPERNMMAPGPEKIGRPDSIKLKEGHNRFTWGLRYPDKTIASEDGEQYFGVGAGPMAVPGQYNVRLSVGDWSQTRDLTVQIDPRIKKDGVSKADLQAQLELNLKIRNALGKAQKMAAKMDTLRKRITAAQESDEIAESKAKSLKAGLNKVYGQLVTSEEGSYPPPMWIDQTEYMYYMTISADQRPGNDAYTRFDTLQKELEKIAADWQEFRQNSDLPDSITD